MLALNLTPFLKANKKLIKSKNRFIGYRRAGNYELPNVTSGYSLKKTPADRGADSVSQSDEQ
jgi:hypothetical protein